MKKPTGQTIGIVLCLIISIVSLFFALNMQQYFYKKVMREGAGSAIWHSDKPDKTETAAEGFDYMQDNTVFLESLADEIFGSVQGGFFVDGWESDDPTNIYVKGHFMISDGACPTTDGHPSLTLTTGDACYDYTNNEFCVYDTDEWLCNDITELKTARGSRASLNARLSQSMDMYGNILASPSLSEWVVGTTVTQITSTTRHFIVEGDYSGMYTEGRRVMLNNTDNATNYGTIENATYSAGTGITSITLTSNDTLYRDMYRADYGIVSFISVPDQSANNYSHAITKTSSYITNTFYGKSDSLNGSGLYYVDMSSSDFQQITATQKLTLTEYIPTSADAWTESITPTYGTTCTYLSSLVMQITPTDLSSLTKTYYTGRKIKVYDSSSDTELFNIASLGHVGGRHRITVTALSGDNLPNPIKQVDIYSLKDEPFAGYVKPTMVMISTAAGCNLYFDGGWKWRGSKPSSLDALGCGILTIFNIKNPTTGIIEVVASYEELALQ